MTLHTTNQLTTSSFIESVKAPPLNAGDHLSRQEFEQRYQAHPEIKKAELIEGVVYMPSPVRFEQHSRPHSNLVTWLGLYHAKTPATTVGDNATVRLDFENEVQPDILLRLDSSRGGKSYVTDDDYIEGPPELIVEIVASSAAYDLHTKRRAYARNGVQEYLAVQIYERRINWYVLREGVYKLLTPDENGLLRSEIFPGLWLNIEAFWANDLASILATLEAGVATSNHTEFVSHLQVRS